MIKITALLAIALALAAEAYSPLAPKKASLDLKKAAAGAFAAVTLASNVVSTPAKALDSQLGFGSTTVVAEKVIREGVYGEYEIDLPEQKYDDARSTFKSAKETKSKKGKYTALLGVLVVGSFVIPMAQYFWYVRDDDSSDRFFAQNVPEPDEKPKKGGWFK